MAVAAVISKRTWLNRLAIASAIGIALSTGATPLRAQSADVDAAWRAMFKREVVVPAPAGNPLTLAKVMLGAKLFSDTRLSGNGRRSCASCHLPTRAFTDGRPRALSLVGRPLRRNTPTLWNLAWGKHFYWDGRAASLEDQVGMPIMAANEMAGDWPTIVSQLGADTQLLADFRTAFPDDPRPSQLAIVNALSSYLRSLISPATTFDAWVSGDPNTLRPNELRGFRHFTGKAGCVLCHVGWRFTDDRFHDIGLVSSDPGRGAVAGGTRGHMAFKTPSLRELTKTAPYMHDGSKPTLAAVIQHYNTGVRRRPNVSTHINPDLKLKPGEISDLVAFLRTLSSDRTQTKPPR